uniref:Uncharacterized protein n=1 Tax=Arundo donax TaxID=35708 RepID=A0A0A8Y6M4_ARUDO
MFHLPISERPHVLQKDYPNELSNKESTKFQLKSAERHQFII